LRRLVWLREELRDVSGRMYYLIRRRVLALARERGIGEDIFFQTFQEIDVDDRSQIEARREVFDSFRNFQPPSVIGRQVRYERDRLTADLAGIGASGGIAEGIAHVAHNPADALRAPPGAILICPFVEPGWTPVLGRVAGLVAEIGGRLSHAAVICREIGIPAVLGVPGATRRIRAGQRVTIDGRLGLVSVQEVGIQDAAASAGNAPE
jgi:phosphohistidine swiveling domain-containing protein